MRTKKRLIEEIKLVTFIVDVTDKFFKTFFFLILIVFKNPINRGQTKIGVLFMYLA